MIKIHGFFLIKLNLGWHTTKASPDQICLQAKIGIFTFQNAILDDTPLMIVYQFLRNELFLSN